MRRRLGLGAALVALAVAPAARANPVDTFGFGSRETAMGGAAAAETRGFAASYYNPAALARSRGLELAVGYMRADHHLEMNGQDSRVDPVKGLVGGVVVPGRFVGVPFAFGVGLHLPDHRLSRVRALRQDTPRWELYDNRNQRLFFAANLAIEPFPWLALGGGVTFMASVQGRLDIAGGANVFRPDGSSLRHEIDADATSVRYPQAGARVALGDRAALALVYRGEFQLGLDLRAHLAADVSGLTTAVLDLHTQSVNNFLPQQVVLGGSWEVARDLRATFDATWIDWSAYVPPVPTLDVVLDIPPPSGGWPPSIQPPESPASSRIVPLTMHDRIVPRAGFEWRAVRRGSAEGFVRGGYEVAKSPIAAQTGVTSYVDRDRHTGSVGLGVTLRDLAAELPGALSLDLHLQWSELVSGETLKARAADLVGDFRASGRIVNVGLTTSFAFDPPEPKEAR